MKGEKATYAKNTTNESRQLSDCASSENDGYASTDQEVDLNDGTGEDFLHLRADGCDHLNSCVGLGEVL